MTRHPHPRQLLVLSLVLLVLLAAACMPTVKAPPVAGRTAITGDSIGFQALYFGSEGRPAALEWDDDAKVGLGWKAEHAQPRVTQDVAGALTSPAKFVVEFGHNYGRGFTTENRNAVTQMMFSAEETACVVAVLPYAPATLSATHRQAIADYREHVAAIAYVRPHTVLVDWKPIAEAHPEYIDEDGIHLRTTETTPAEDLEAAYAIVNGQVVEVPPVYRPAAEAFLDMIQSGLDMC